MPPKTDSTRPITDRVKESVFSILYNKGFPDGKKVADIFSGTGSLGLEALSRGAEFCLFGEKDPKVIEILNKNIERAGFVAESKILRANIFKLGAPVGEGESKFDLVFVDPPYVMSTDTCESSQLGELLLMLNRQIVENGLALVRTDHHVELLESYGSLKLSDVRKWGTMKVFFLENVAGEVNAGE